MSGTNKVSMIDWNAPENPVHNTTRQKISHTWFASHTGPIEWSIVARGSAPRSGPAAIRSQKPAPKSAPANTQYHRLGFIIPFTVAAIATPVQMFVGDTLARWVFSNEPTKFAAIELVPKTSSDVPETLLGHLNADRTVSGGIKVPGLASWLSDPSNGKSTVVHGLNAYPASNEPTVSEVNVVHLAWDIMVGLAIVAERAPVGDQCHERPRHPERHQDDVEPERERHLRTRPRDRVDSEDRWHRHGGASYCRTAAGTRRHLTS